MFENMFEKVISYGKRLKKSSTMLSSITNFFWYGYLGLTRKCRSEGEGLLLASTGRPPFSVFFKYFYLFLFSLTEKDVKILHQIILTTKRYAKPPAQLVK